MSQLPGWFQEWYQASYDAYLMFDQFSLDAQKISSLTSDFIYYDQIDALSDGLKVAMIKLNGGLGTSMGCYGPKSLIKCAEDGRNFLDIIIHHFNESHDITDLILLNSFNTSSQTTSYLRDHYPELSWHEVMQYPFKKIDLNTNQPFFTNNDDSLNPPGHGSIFFDLYHSGILHKLNKKNVDYVFISNADNLAATVDPRISSYLNKTNVPFLIELTEKFDSDRKGGTVINYDGQLKLWESAQVSDDQAELFESQPVFNTNNIWVHVQSLIDCIESDLLQLDLILNKKSSTDSSWVQLEYAMGSAIQSFSNAQVMVVPRSRFFPIKKVSDYLLLLSDFTFFDDSSHLIWDILKRPDIRCLPPFDRIDTFDKYFSVIPSLKNIDSLDIGGELFFDAHVSLSGHMNLCVPDGQVYRINEQKDLLEFS